MTSDLIPKTESTFRTKALIVGPILGAAVGVAGAVILIQSMERRNAELRISAREGISLTLLIMALLRQISDLPNERK
jgi:hypothetical protein